MDGMMQRPGGMYVVRLSVPVHLRSAIGKTELVQTTGTKNLPLAKVVATGILSAWRQRLFDLSHLADPTMDLDRVALGHPGLSLAGYFPLAEASAMSGIDAAEFWRSAAAGELLLHVSVQSVQGHVVAETSLEAEPWPTGLSFTVPSANRMPVGATELCYSGMLRVHLDDRAGVAATLERNEAATLVALTMPNRPGMLFLPDTPIRMTAPATLVATANVEGLRRRMASFVTPAQLADARSRAEKAHTAVAVKHGEKAQLPSSEAVEAYMKIRRMHCNNEQARRVQGALDLFVELTGNKRLGEVSSDVLDRYRDDLLPTVPASENKVRLQFGSKSILESIVAVDGKNWPRISASEQVKRLQWLAAMFSWLFDKGWLVDDPGKTLLRESSAKVSAQKSAERKQDARSMFSREHLTKIFSHGSWFKTGRGEITAANTYREFSPHYYWLPLIGLYTGARINEVAQLHLQDIKKTVGGTPYFEFALLDDEDGKKRRKNPNARRSVPVHPHLVELGLLSWCDSLASAGYARLFPELRHNDVKGFGKAATNWFSRYLSSLGWTRDGRLVFHSFRSTLVNECVHRLDLSLAQTAQITGHAEGMSSTLGKHYLKDREVDALAPTVATINFELPPIAPFNIRAGLDATKDAMRRKNRGAGAAED